MKDYHWWGISGLVMLIGGITKLVATVLTLSDDADKYSLTGVMLLMSLVCFKFYRDRKSK